MNRLQTSEVGSRKEPASGGRQPPVGRSRDVMFALEQGAEAPRSPRVRFLLLVSCLLLASPAHAALDPETTTPYRVQAVLHITEHRLLTGVFKDQIQRELRDGMQAALGPMGSVDVVRTHPRLKEIDAKGLQVALDGPQELSAGKTLFVLIDFVDDQYVIRTRQMDGMTGLVSPVRQARTSDRQFVARTAALLLDRDFGLVGTLDSGEPKGEVKITIKGSGLGVPFGRWVRKGEVFAIVQVHKTGNKATRVPWALLVATADPKPGETTLPCKLYQRYRQSLAGGASLAGHRCLKLGAMDAPLHLRLIDDKKLRPLPDQALTIRAHGFDGKSDEESSTDVDGYFVSRKPYARVVFVQVHSGEAVRARFPVEIIDDRPIVCPISVDPKAELVGQLELQRRQWIGQLYENLLVVDALFKRLNDYVDKKDHAGALKEAQAGLTRLQTELAARADEKRALADPSVTLDLGEGEQRLNELTMRRDELQKFADNLDKVIRQATDPKRVEMLAMVEQAQLLEREAEFAKAIALHRKIAEGSADHPAVKADAEKQLARLEKQWAVKGDEHAKARKFIYETWPKVDGPAQLKDKIDEAEKAFQTCRANNDVLTPRMLLRVNLTHASKLAKRLEALRLADNEDDRREAETLVAVSDQLKKLIEQVTAYLRK